MEKVKKIEDIILLAEEKKSLIWKDGEKPMAASFFCNMPLQHVIKIHENNGFYIYKPIPKRSKPKWFKK